MKLKVRRGDKQKVVIAPSIEAGLQPDDDVELVLVVNKPGYAPPGVAVRTRSGDDIITGTAPASLLGQLEKDKFVKSVQVARPLKMSSKRR